MLKGKLQIPSPTTTLKNAAGDQWTQ